MFISYFTVNLVQDEEIAFILVCFCVNLKWLRLAGSRDYNLCLDLNKSSRHSIFPDSTNLLNWFWKLFHSKTHCNDTIEIVFTLFYKNAL